MGIRDIVILTDTVKVDEKVSFEVRGLSLNDLMLVAFDYGPQISTVFAKMQAGDFDTADLRGAVLDASREFPDLLAALICMAADDYEPEIVQRIKKVQAHVTADAIEKVFTLTFRSEADVKKLVESLTRMFVAGTATLSQVTSPASGTGIGDSVAH